MADPDYALVEILCSPSQFGDVAAIPNLIVLASPLYGDTPNVIAMNASRTRWHNKQRSNAMPGTCCSPPRITPRSCRGL